MESRPASLAFEHVSKSFGVVQALRDVSFGVAAGSVHALLGENGAGKSTLLKILSGALEPTLGTLRLAAREVTFASPRVAIAAGVGVIHQELHLVPQLSVAENLFLGHLPARAGFVRHAQLRARASELIARMQIDLDPARKVASLSIGQQQMVEIMKALSRGARILAFDEPTSSLSQRETEQLFAVIRELKRQGHVILYVTHRMDEVFAVCDAATVLRDGEHVRTYASLDQVARDDLVRAMIGRELYEVYAYRPRALGARALELERVTGPGLADAISLSVASGEIVGMFGLVGAGRTELMRLIFGAERARTGVIRVMGEACQFSGPRDAIRAGVLLCPEDRKQEGIVPMRSVAENINLSARRRTARWRFLLDARWERENATAQIESLRIKTPSLQQLVRHLSGGNQQKVILARWLSESVRVLLLDEPTRGIDIGARSEIYHIIADLAAQGIGVLLASSDLPEVLGVSDRVLVMREHRLVGCLERGRATEESVLRMALPQTEKTSA